MNGLDEQKPYTVSVVIPAYNIEAYIGRAIKSVLAQTHPADEIIVVDDGSTDGTAEQIKKFGDQVHYIFKENGGLSSARNAGIRAAKSEWMAFLDGDDEWLPGSLDRQLALLERNRHLNWSSANFLRCLCDEDRQGPDHNPDKIKELLAGKEYFDNYFFAVKHHAGGHPNTMFIRRKVFTEVGDFDENQKFAEDHDMWWRITYRWPKVGYVTEPLAIYHMVRPGTLTDNYKHSQMVILCDLLERHLKLAAQNNQSVEFDLIAGKMIRNWMRYLIFINKPDQIREMLKRFDRLLPTGFKWLMRILTTFPNTTSKCCQLISRVVRYFNLRRHIVRRVN